MEAFLITEAGKTQFAEVDEPRLKPGEALLRVNTIGFCGSDLTTYRGQNPMVSYPRIPGHEIGATIVSVADGVPEHLAPGLHVTVSPYTSCGRCAACRGGRPNCCKNNQTMGVQRDGAFTKLVAVPWEKIIVCEGLGLRELALVEPLSVGFHAVDRGRVRAGETVAVFGCGMIGLGVIAGAANRGARVIAIDVDDSKTALARRIGAKETINSASEPLHERLESLTDGLGPDVIIEAVGLADTFRATVEEAAFAGRVVYIGYAKKPVEYETKLFVQKELDILGSRNALPEDFEAVARLMGTGAFPSEAMVTWTVPFAESGRALEDWSANPGAVTKIHVELGN